LSCEEEFSPFGDYRERYVLFSLLQGDSTFQVVTIGKSFGHGTLTPDESVNYFVEDADVRVWKGDSVFVFRDSSINDMQFYYSNNFTIDYNESVEIEALLPNGRRLKSSTKTPNEFNFRTSEVLIPPVINNFVQINWENEERGIFYQSRLFLRYRLDDNPEIKIKEIPQQYVLQNGKYMPAFNKPSADLSVVFQMDAVTKAMEEISKDETEKEKFFIYEGLIVEVASLDASLSRYVSSTSKSFDDLTVRINELDYTNVEGGFGVFGSYITKTYKALRFQPGFVNSFGYRFIGEQ
jgi:hypothetical protein